MAVALTPQGLAARTAGSANARTRPQMRRAFTPQRPISHNVVAAATERHV